MFVLTVKILKYISKQQSLFSRNWVSVMNFRRHIITTTFYIAWVETHARRNFQVWKFLTNPSVLSKRLTVLTRCVRHAHRWDTPGSICMRQAKVVVNLYCGILHVLSCQYRTGNRAETLCAVIYRRMLTNEFIKISVHRCALRNENALLEFHCDVTTDFHLFCDHGWAPCIPIEP